MFQKCITPLALTAKATIGGSKSAGKIRPGCRFYFGQDIRCKGFLYLEGSGLVHHRGIVLAVYFHSQFVKNPIDEAKVVGKRLLDADLSAGYSP